MTADRAAEGSIPPTVEMLGITKSYGEVRANRGIDLKVEHGEILGLLGENGSGKSTLMKVLFGMVQPDEGRVVLKGRAVHIRSPADALALGIGMVHQHFMLVGQMSVTENVLLALCRSGLRLRASSVASDIRRASRDYGLELEPDAIVADLSFGMRQRVEILKLILGGADLLVLDEPTSNLSAPEVVAFIGIMRRLAAEGRSFVFISHKLGEVLAVCDRVVVLRDGAVAGRREVSGASRADLARMMVGRDLPPAPDIRRAAPGAVLFSATGLTTRPAGQAVPLRGLSFAIRSGEILAVAGVDGNGQTELAEALAGMDATPSGRIDLAGRDLARDGAAARLAAGLSYIPVDRGGTSLVPGMSVAENLALRDTGREPFSRLGWLRLAELGRSARARIAEFGIRCAGPDAPARSLSGGNQQKIVIAREIGRGAKALVAVQPTWGLDPGATRAVQDSIRALRDDGGAVLYVSAELEEVLELGDRVAVLHEGRLSRPVARDEVDLTRIGLLMAGDRSAWDDEPVPLAA